MSCAHCLDCPARCAYGKCPLADIAFTSEPDLLPTEPAPRSRYGLVLLVVWAIGMALVLIVSKHP